ncbi:MAG TPA: hypothetical protein VEM93_09865 [Actinomycetota bacterium]|nr:hypothetical protein [Actinomycetota bacterium]
MHEHRRGAPREWNDRKRKRKRHGQPRSDGDRPSWDGGLPVCEPWAAGYDESGRRLGHAAIENDTGRELPLAGFYILDARTGDRVGGEVKDPTSIPNGETKTFKISFGGLAIKDIGLVILLVGHDNYGAFARQ